MVIDVFVIRHKASGELMPLMRRGKGYSHWNPGNQKYVIQAQTDTPRILLSKKQAQGVINQWNAIPNGKMHYSSPSWYNPDGDESMDIKPDGRRKEDLEIVPAKLEIQDANTSN